MMEKLFGTLSWPLEVAGNPGRSLAGRCLIAISACRMANSSLRASRSPHTFKPWKQFQLTHAACCPFPAFTWKKRSSLSFKIEHRYSETQLRSAFWQKQPVGLMQKLFWGEWTSLPEAAHHSFQPGVFKLSWGAINRIATRGRCLPLKATMPPQRASPVTKKKKARIRVCDMDFLLLLY